jgi:hypothetical protein
MSTQIGTLQPNTRAAQPMWPVAILALLVVAIVAVIVAAPNGTRPAEETTSAGTDQAVVGAPVSTGVPATHGKQVGIDVAGPRALAGTVVNTPTELTGGIAFSNAGTVTASPTELSGRFLAERAKQLGTEIGTVTGGSGTGTGGVTGNTELCEICWKYR